MNFNNYSTESFFDEMFDSDSKVREGYLKFKKRIEEMDQEELIKKQYASERALLSLGVTFNVYGKKEPTERIWPLDIVPRIIPKEEWDNLERGLKQRITALNIFIDDIYHKQNILKDKIIPRELIETCKCFLPQCMGLNPPKGIWCHITGTDLIRDEKGVFYVLEDNLRCPSGAAYVLQNRELLKNTFPELFEQIPILPVHNYPFKLLEMLQYVSSDSKPNLVLLTPGIYNSAYYEHTYLAQQLGIELVEGRDLVVQSGEVKMRTTKGLQRVDVIYRRMDDTSLDPKVFNPKSILGIPGIFELYKKGKVTLVNAPGTGVADDKVIYAYVPEMIKYYLGESAIIPNVPTYLCWEEKDLKYVLLNIEKLVVKEAHQSGGYGMMIGPNASKSEHEEFRKKIKSNPRNYIAQPVINLSQVPTIVDDHFEGRHVDFRPYILYGESIYVVPGGLTRVALRKGSLVVNSSQGGGSKDTWVLGG